MSSSATILIECLEAFAEPPGQAIVYGDRGQARWQAGDTYLAILGMVRAFLDMTKTGIAPVRPEESLLLAELALELTEAATAGERAGRRVALPEGAGARSDGPRRDGPDGRLCR